LCNASSQNLKVSIIIPVHNAEKTLERCINSVMTQGYDNIECILVENGSSDHSAAVCDYYADKFNRVITKSMDVSGVSDARNLGLSIASGDIIGFCDADDWIEPGAIKRIVEEFWRNTRIAAVFGAFYIGTPQKEILDKVYRGLEPRLISPTKALQYTLINDSVRGAVWNKYYRAEFLRKIEFDADLSYCEDMHFNAKVLCRMDANDIVSIIHDPVYCYVQTIGSLTHNPNNLYDENNNLKIIVAMRRIQVDCKLDKMTIGLLKMKIARFCIGSIQGDNPNTIQRGKLINDLEGNYVFLLRYIYHGNIRSNIKYAYRGFLILMKSCRSQEAL
jgi:glycosyltransferase involved in cell wall biosynthesis